MSAAVDARMTERERLWREKPAVRRIYRHLCARMHQACAPGATLEIGGGTGIFKEFAPDTITTDIMAAPWLDVVADAQRLPFADAHFANIVMIDVLHHIEVPRRFFEEALRLLKPGGRLVMVEPAITPLSWPFYHFVHQEPVDLGADPLHEREPSKGRDPFAANQAVPTLLATRHRDRMAAAFPNLKLHHRAWLSLLAYPLSGGFKSWSALPNWLAGPLLAIEDVAAPLLGRLAGFRLLLVYEKTG